MFFRATHIIYSSAQHYGLTCNHYSAKFLKHREYVLLWNETLEEAEEEDSRERGEENSFSNTPHSSAGQTPLNFLQRFFLIVTVGSQIIVFCNLKNYLGLVKMMIDISEI